MAENTSRFIGTWSYVLSAMLTEIPRAIFQSCIFVGMIYTIRPLNPDIINQLFFLVCLIVGVLAWQSQITMCAAITDNLPVAYSMAFLVIGSGTLFGGLMLRFSKIPAIFRVFYFISVTAVTQRAIIVNDMQCCYLTSTCNSLIAEWTASPSTSGEQPQGNEQSIPPINSFLYSLPSTSSVISTTFPSAFQYYVEESRRLLNASDLINFLKEEASYCPPGIQLTGDGSDEGNLGRLYLRFMGLEGNFPFFSLIYLFIVNIVFRVSSGGIHLIRKYFRNQLLFIHGDAIPDKAITS